MRVFTFVEERSEVWKNLRKMGSMGLVVKDFCLLDYVFALC